jgi:aryl-alcohol dehydrogenase-like predicted oxidoreductase/enamine deaminase RidA (YjgF/YER057c/UK114 family)
VTVEHRALAADLKVSGVITGLWQIADMERRSPLDRDAAVAAMAMHADAGFTTFDMADHYGSAEDVTGLFLSTQADRTRIQVLTKWVPTPGPVTRAAVRVAIERSLTRLRTDWIDLLQFHAWNYADPSWLDCLFWLEELRAAGLIRHLGVTNFDTIHLLIALRSGIELVSNQVSYSLLDQRASGEMTTLCREHRVALLAYGTIAGGLLSGRWLGQIEPKRQALDTWSQMKYARFIDAAGGWSALQRVLRAVADVARRHDVSMANVAERYIFDQPAVAGIIVGARLGQRTHLPDNVRLFEFALDAADHALIESALATLDPIPGDVGDEYRRPPFLTASGDLSHHVETFPAPYPVRAGSDGRDRVFTGTAWESIAGFARAVRRGNRIWISGTTATHGDRVIGGSDAGAQMHFIIDKIDGALQSLGARLGHIVRTRVYVRNPSDWESVARVHGDRFREIRPSNTLVQAGLVGSEYLVEMEAEAEV